MPSPYLHLLGAPALEASRMVLSFTGWMDGGDASTGTVGHLVKHLDATPIAHIEPGPFYIYNFPGSMEVSALFRPAVHIVDGSVVSLDMPDNTFYHCPGEDIILFVGKEPNLQWPGFAQAIFDLAQLAGVGRLYFVGTFAGAMPHTRLPHIFATVTNSALRPELQQRGVRFSNYRGPASFATYLMTQATRHGLDMASLVAEIPGYIEGSNPLSIEAVTRHLAAILGLQLDLAEMRGASDEWESRVSAAVAKDPDLARQIRKLEKQYDDELLDRPAEP